MNALQKLKDALLTAKHALEVCRDTFKSKCEGQHSWPAGQINTALADINAVLSLEKEQAAAASVPRVQYDDLHSAAVEKDRLWSLACDERNTLTAENAALREEVARLSRSLEEETAIVDRVWAALGCNTYDDCNPFAILEALLAAGE